MDINDSVVSVMGTIPVLEIGQPKLRQVLNIFVLYKMTTAGGSMSKHKLVFLGEQAVGKTSIITRFMYDNYDSNYQATIGIDFLSKTLWFGERPVRLQLWDTAGQERFRSLIPSYIRDSSAAVVVFDVTNRQSFDNIDQWIKDVRAERGKGVYIALVGNKVDCEPDKERQVTTQEAEEKAKQLGVVFYETSAKTGHNIRTLFNEIAVALPGVDTVASHNTSVDIQLNANPLDDEDKKGLCRC